MIINIILIILGFIMLVKGADFLVDGSAYIAKKMKIPDIIIGLTLVSVGTSLPELIINIKAAMENSSDISVGNIIGSCICNLLFVLAITTIVKPVHLDENTRKIDFPLYLISIFLIAIFGNFGLELKRIEGALLILFLSIFILQLYIRNKENSEELTNLEQDNTSIIKKVIIILLGAILLKYGGDFVLENSKNLAYRFGLSEKFIGLTIIAIGTSLPELVTSIISIMNGKEQLAIGNIIGSNIFNILLVLGISCLINPIKYSVDFNINIIYLFVFSFLIWGVSIINKNHKIKRGYGIFLVLCYFLYFAINI